MNRVATLYQTDDSIIEGIRNFDDAAVTTLYKKHKDYCLRFINKLYYDEETNKDIYQDAVIVFIEKVRYNNLKLDKTSIQTYLNSICKNQVLVRFKSANKLHLAGDEMEANYNHYTDWMDDLDDVNSKRLQIIKEELIKMKDSGSVCFDILKKFFFENKTMDQIASLMNYTNSDNAKNQKWRCQDRLKKQVFTRLSNE